MGIADVIFLASAGAMFALTTAIVWHQRRAMEREAARWKAELKAQNDALRMARRR
jgi:hypothetical protein